MLKPLTVIFLIVFVLIVPFPVFAQSEAAGSAIFVLSKTETDERIETLRKFFDQFNSPLKPYAGNFIQAADRYELDWRLIPAITGAESTFGKFIPFNSYNAYGWANGEYYFNSWEESIEIVAKTLQKNYFDRGLDTVEKIAPVYAPPSKTWARNVRYFMEKLEYFTPSTSLALKLSL